MLKMTGIKCDAAACDFHDHEVQRAEYINFINQPCPNCGANLLTEKDYQAVLALEKFANCLPVRMLNKIASWFGKKPGTFKVEMNGSGQVNVKNARRA